MSQKFRILLSLWLPALSCTVPAVGPEEETGELAYRVVEVALPQEMVPEISAVAFSPAGRLVVANRHGEVWIREKDEITWKRFAYGLHEPLGLQVLSESVVYVSHKPEVTRLRDTAGDGVADHYDTIAESWGISDNWHEHTFGLPRDHQGNFVVALGLPDPAGPIYTLHSRGPVDLSPVLKERKLSIGPFQGWVLKITPEGETIPWATGFRQPAGVAVSPDGEIFVTDQQGDYIGSSALVHVPRDMFYAHPAGLKWHPDFRDRPVTMELLEKIRGRDSVILPHGSMGGSPGEPVWDDTGGKFGPFQGQVFIGDFTKLISRVYLERVHGEFQGAAFPFLRDATGIEAILTYSGRDNVSIPAGAEGQKYFRDVPPLPGTGLRQGNMKAAFAPDGSLYVGQTTRGWGVGDGLQRIVWTGRNPVEVHTMEILAEGFALTFTEEMDAGMLSRTENYRMLRFRYLYHEHYGSPRIDRAEVPITRVKVDDSKRRVELALSELRPGFVYELELDGLRSGDGRQLANPLAYYTVNRLVGGEVFEGPLTRPLEESSGDEEEDEDRLASGRRVYDMYCVACHQSDGRGGGVPGPAAGDFVGDPTILGKSDEELLKIIAEGRADGVMPPFGHSLTVRELRDVLLFVRTAFGDSASPESEHR